MSHFTVMVIGDDAEQQLAPYHEYECTGNDDQYVIDVDCSDEIEEWLKETLWTGLDIDTDKPDYQHSEDAAKKHMNKVITQSRGAWFEEVGMNVQAEVQDYFGYRKDPDGKYFQHTNPNAKWDWYQVGGRWSGFFKVKNAAEAGHGERSWTNRDEASTPDYADITTKGNIDLITMQADIREERMTAFDQLLLAMGDTDPVSWTELRDGIDADGGNVDDAREAYKNTPFRKAISAYEMEHHVSIGGFMGSVYEDFYLHLPLNQARVRYVETGVMNVVTPYAFVKDGKWVERGEMGWWGMSSNEKDKDAWAVEFYKMFNALPDDTLITMVDCHI